MSKSGDNHTTTANCTGTPQGANDESRQHAPIDAGRGQHEVETRRFSWRPRRGVRKRALFRVTVHGVILQHVRTTCLQQRGGPSETTLDAGAALEDVPEWARDELRRDGHALVAGGVA